MAKNSWTCRAAGCTETAPHLHCRSCPAPVPPDRDYCSKACAIHGGATKRRAGEVIGWFQFTGGDGKLYRKRLWMERNRLEKPTLVRRPPRDHE